MDLTRALDLAHLAEDVFQVVTYDRLQAAQEDAARWEFDDVVSRKVRRLAG